MTFSSLAGAIIAISGLVILMNQLPKYDDSMAEVPLQYHVWGGIWTALAIGGLAIQFLTREPEKQDENEKSKKDIEMELNSSGISNNHL